MARGCEWAQAPAVRQVLDDFQRAQGERMRVYEQLHAGFRDMLQTQQEAPYRRLIGEATAAFQELSSAVRAGEARLRSDLARPDLADMLRAVQEGERDKLRMTLTLQALRRAAAPATWSWQRPRPQSAGAGQLAPAPPPGPATPAPTAAGASSLASPPAAPSSAAAAAQPGEAGLEAYAGILAQAQAQHAAAAASGAHRCGCGSGGPGAQAEVGEPSQEDFNGAVAEAMQGLQAAVEVINEALEEVRYARQELDEVCDGS